MGGGLPQAPVPGSLSEEQATADCTGHVTCHGQPPGCSEGRGPRRFRLCDLTGAGLEGGHSAEQRSSCIPTFAPKDFWSIPHLPNSYYACSVWGPPLRHYETVRGSRLHSDCSCFYTLESELTLILKTIPAFTNIKDDSSDIRLRGSEVAPCVLAASHVAGDHVRALALLSHSPTYDIYLFRGLFSRSK